SVSKGFDLLCKKTNITPNDVINNIKQIELTKIPTFKNINFKNDTICNDFVSNFKDLISKKLTIDTFLKTTNEYKLNKIPANYSKPKSRKR
ncbi:hypothetical protein, partial [Helicobacter sp. T3_23-1059]